MEFLVYLYIVFVCVVAWSLNKHSPEFKLDSDIEAKWKVRYFKRSLLKLDLCDSKSYEDDYFYHF
jgi:hypothetical protein